VTPDSPVRDAVLRRRSRARVTAEAPSTDDLLSLVEAAATVADHSGLRPWRLLEIRGVSRSVVGRAIAAAGGATGQAAELLAQKPLRAPLLVGVVLSPRESRKVPEWEQEAVASGIAHILSLLLDEAGWGVMWRTGIWTRSPQVHAAHGLAESEKLLGWLYVGGIDAAHDVEARKPSDAAHHVSAL
jgi:nitroreductase